MWALQDTRLAGGSVVDVTVDGDRIGELRATGVNVLFGQDCVNDGFYSFGRGSMLEVALISAHAANLTTRSDLAYALPVPTWEEALRLQPLPEMVWFAGRLVAENRVSSTLHRLTAH